MQVSNDTWHYHLWDLTHIFSSSEEEPEKILRKTNRFRYVSRITLMTIPVGISIFALVVSLLALIAIIEIISPSTDNDFWRDSEDY